MSYTVIACSLYVYAAHKKIYMRAKKYYTNIVKNFVFL